MTIRLVKAQGAGNDFLLARGLENLPDAKLAALARAICDRHHGVGADGLIVFTGPARIRLFNSDGSEAELSGNGTRCAAALLIDEGAAVDAVTIETQAGPKSLRLLDRRGNLFRLEMGMGTPSYRPDEIGCSLETSQGLLTVTLVNVGNPQCALVADVLPENWQELGAAIEPHPRFPKRTNVSFVRPLDRHTIEARFYERGAGATLSSGTGATGAAVAAILSGRVESPVRVVTLADDLEIDWRPGEEARLRGPAEIIARGEFYWPEP
jgi:diaminopimelate epimerase